MTHANLPQTVTGIYRRLAAFNPTYVVVMTATALAATVLLRAWVCEDAYITFRVIDNFAMGDGLRWNLHERVQVYTHPLWLLLHLPLRAIWENVYHINILLSVMCAAAAIVVTLGTKRQPLPVTLALFFAPFLLSKSVMDYTSSGLESPLCYLTYALFGLVIIRLRGHRYFWFYLSLTTALALLTRLDTIILLAPALAYLLFSEHATIRWRQIALGALPLLAWFAFALAYYGFIFPNTKYAKLGTGMALSQYLQQSFIYLKQLALFDMAGVVILLSAALHMFRRNNLAASLAFGVYGYFLYVLYIGGDYMSGRFWALPVFASLWLAYMFPFARLRNDALFCVACLLAAGYLASPMMRAINKNCDECIVPKSRIIDAAHTFRMNRMVAEYLPPRIRSQGRYPFYREGIKIAQEMPKVKVLFYVGMPGYYAGSNIKIIDMLGLTDPLLARLPAAPAQGFYIGHFRREIPKGYERAVETGIADEMDPSLARYYDALRLITEGELFTRERLKTIVLFNLGYYDKWKYEYLRSKKR